MRPNRSLAGPGGVRGSKGPLARLVADETGSATVEFALWIPLFCFLLISTADLGILLMRHAEMWDIARDAARRMAIYQMSADEARSHVIDRLAEDSDALVVEAEVGDEVRVLITVPTAHVLPFGVFGSAMNGTVVTRVTMLREPI